MKYKPLFSWTVRIPWCDFILGQLVFLQKVDCIGFGSHSVWTPSFINSKYVAALFQKLKKKYYMDLSHVTCLLLWIPKNSPEQIYFASV